MKQLNIALVVILTASQSLAATQSSYPTKTSPVSGDKALITDSEDSNKTKQATFGSLPISTATQAALNLKETKAVVQSSAPADTTVDWYDTDQEDGVLILKRHNGTTWVRASSHGVQYATSCAGIAAGMCVDTDDGKLYYHNGTAVVEVGTGGSGTTYTAGTGIDITSGVISSTVTGTLPPGTEGQGLQKGASAWEAVNYAPLAFTDNVSRNSTTGVVSVPVTATATSGSVVPLTSGGAYTALAGKQDALVSGTSIKTVNNASLLGAGNITIAGGTGGGLTSTLSSAPYSDVACTADGVYNHTLYKCVDDGTGTGYFTEYVATTTYSNATPVDTTPDAFSFADVTNATLSTEYTALAQINGIAAGITCSGSGGTVAACTGSTVGTCGTFGATSGSITNGQYVGAKVTSSGTASTATNNVVTCSGVSDTFTAITAGGVYTDDFNRADETPLSGSGVWTNPGGSYYVLKVESNAVTSMSGNGIAYYATASHTFTANQYSQVKVTTNDNAFAGPVARFNPGTSYYYQAGIYYGDAKISRVRGDGNSASWVVASGPSIAGKVLKLAATGSSPVTLKLYIDGVQIGSDVVDSSAYALTSGQPGIGTTGTGVIDNWQAGEL